MFKSLRSAKSVHDKDKKSKASRRNNRVKAVDSWDTDAFEALNVSILAEEEITVEDSCDLFARQECAQKVAMGQNSFSNENALKENKFRSKTRKGTQSLVFENPVPGLSVPAKQTVNKVSEFGNKYDYENYVDYKPSGMSEIDLSQPKQMRPLEARRFFDNVAFEPTVSSNEKEYLIDELEEGLIVIGENVVDENVVGEPVTETPIAEMSLVEIPKVDMPVPNIPVHNIPTLGIYSGSVFQRQQLAKVISDYEFEVYLFAPGDSVEKLENKAVSAWVVDLSGDESCPLLNMVISQSADTSSMFLVDQRFNEKSVEKVKAFINHASMLKAS